MKNSATTTYNIFLMIGDFLSLVLAFVGAYILRVTFTVGGTAPSNQIEALPYLQAFLMILPLWILVFGLLGLYNHNIYERRFSEFGRLLVGSFIGLLAVVFVDFLLLEPIFPGKLVPIYAFGLGFIFLLMFRNLARTVKVILHGFDKGITRVLIVGNTAISEELRTSLYNRRKSGYQVLGVVGDKRRVAHADYQNFEEAIAELKDKDIHGIIQTELYADESRNREVLEYAQTHHLSYRFVPGNTELFVGNIEVELFRSSIPVIAVHQTALLGWGRVVKRAFDIVFSTLFIILTSPLMLLVAIAILIEDGRPVFFRQKRLTRYNQEFFVYKFRTNNSTYSGLTPDEAFTKMNRPDLLKQFRDNGNFLPRDPRYTRVARVIRKTSIDEIPQLFNVFKGELSLVGPRALLSQDLAEYDKRHTILSVKSGITGLAQVSGRNNIPIDERRKLDVYYVQNWSFWLDVIILFKTIRVILTDEKEDKVSKGTETSRDVKKVTRLHRSNNEK